MDAKFIEQEREIAKLLVDRERLLSALRELLDEHTDGILGISPACIDRARAAIAAVLVE